MSNATTDEARPQIRQFRLWRCLWVLFIVVGIGLASRTFARNWSPDWMLLYGGDALWAAALYGFLLLGLRLRSALFVFGLTVIGATLIEISQLYQADWIQLLRATVPFNFILGQGFLVTDLVAYVVGALGMLWVDLCWIRPKNNSATLRL
jgi:hypothetical protein